MSGDAKQVKRHELALEASQNFTWPKTTGKLVKIVSISIRPTSSNWWINLHNKRLGYALFLDQVEDQYWRLLKLQAEIFHINGHLIPRDDLITVEMQRKGSFYDALLVFKDMRKSSILLYIASESEATLGSIVFTSLLNHSANTRLFQQRLEVWTRSGLKKRARVAFLVVLIIKLFFDTLLKQLKCRKDFLLSSAVSHICKLFHIPDHRSSIILDSGDMTYHHSLPWRQLTR